MNMAIMSDVVMELLKRDVPLTGHGFSLVLLSIIMPLVCLILTLNRVWWRSWIGRTFGKDDGLIIISMFFNVVMCVCNIIAVSHGYGRPSHTLTAEDTNRALFWFSQMQIYYKVSINLTKLSILCLYLRLFTGKVFRAIVWTMVSCVLVYATASIIATIFQCIPVPRIWDKKIAGHCINLTQFWDANAAYNISTDIIIWSLPIPVIRGLNMPKRAKLGLVGIFALGVFVVITSIIRITTLNPSSKSVDPTEGTLTSTNWTTVEANTAIICACLPMLRTPLALLFPRLFTQTAYGSTFSSRGTRTQQSQTQTQTDVETGLHGRGARTQQGNAIHLNKVGNSSRSTGTGTSEEQLTTDNPKAASVLGIHPAPAPRTIN